MKRSFISSLIMLSILLLGCNVSPDTAKVDYVENPIVNLNVQIQIGIAPTGNVISGAFEYDAYLFWTNTALTSYEGEFNDATILINDIEMALMADDFFRLNSGRGLCLNVGDNVEVIIDHPLVGTIIKRLTVPNNITGFMLTPALTVGIENTYDAYNMSWARQDCAEYSVRLNRYTASSSLSSYSNTIPGFSNSWGSFLFYENAILLPFLKFSLWAADSVYIDSLNSYSKIHVDSPIAASISNMQ